LNARAICYLVLCCFLAQSADALANDHTEDLTDRTPGEAVGGRLEREKVQRHALVKAFHRLFPDQAVSRLTCTLTRGAIECHPSHSNFAQGR